MAATRIALASELLASVLNGNKEVLNELQFKVGMSRFEKESPLVSKIVVSADLVPDCSALPDDEHGLAAINAVLEAVRGFIEIFLGAEDAERMIAVPVTDFATANTGEISRLGLWEALPILQRFSFEAPVEDVSAMDDRAQLEAIFSDVYGTLLSAAKPEQLPVYKNKLSHALTGTAKADLADGKVRVSLDEGAEPGKAASAMSQALDSLVELGETYFDRPRAFEEAVALLRPRLVAYGDAVERLGVSETILRGALARHVRFGIEPLDAALRGGIPKGSSFALQGPPGWEKSAVALRFAKEGLDGGGSVLLVSSGRGPDDIFAELEALGVDCAKHVKSMALVIVDYYSCRMRSVSGFDESPGVIACSEDVTNLGLALGSAIRRLKPTPVMRAVLDFTSYSAVMDDPETAYEFLAMAKAKLSKAGLTSLFVLTKEAHEERELRQLHSALDGVLEIEREVEDQVRRSMRVVSASAGLADLGQIGVSMGRAGLTFSSGTSASMVMVQDRSDRTVSGIPGLDTIFSAGFPDRSSILVYGHPEPLRDSLLVHFARGGFALGGPLLIITARKGAADIVAEYRTVGLDLEAPENRSRVAIVDWHSHTQRRVIGVERDGNRFVASNDLTNLGVAIDSALRHLGSSKGLRCVSDATSSALRSDEPGTVIKFALSLAGKLRQTGATSAFTMDKGAHDASAVAVVMEIFDCIMEVFPAEDERLLAPLSMRGLLFDGSVMRLSSDAGGPSIHALDRGMTQGEGLRKKAKREGQANDVEKLKRELERVTAERMMLAQRIEELAKREREVEKDREDFKSRLDEFNREISRRAKQRERIDALEKNSKIREAEEVELAKVLKKLDDILEHLPDDKVSEFARSEEYKLYERILDRVLKGDRTA
jgi:KaiC/GvpD/RAD55 family RecA-like ATPase